MSWIFLIVSIVFCTLLLKVLTEIRSEFVKVRAMLDSVNEKMLLQNEQNLKNMNNIYTEIAMHFKQTEKFVEENIDNLYEEAKKQVIKNGLASASLLQRKMKVGYARAAQLLDMLEENGIIDSGDGAKPRKVIKQD